MRFHHALWPLAPALISARFLRQGETDQVVLNPDEKFLIETAPGKTQWVTEDEKWELRRVSCTDPCVLSSSSLSLSLLL